MNPAALVLFGLSAAGIALGVGFGVTVGEDAGTALLIGAGLVSAVGGLAVVAAQGRDVPASDVARQPASLAPGGTSVWPVGVGLAALLVATGLATGGALVWFGMAAAAVAGVGWFAQSWASHPTWTDEQNERVSSRLIMPVALPLGITALVVLLAVAFSRTLLAVDKNTAVLIALVAALVILGGGVMVALRGLGRSAVLGLLTVGALATAGLGVGGAVAGEREFHQAGGESGGPAGEGEEGEPEASTARRIEISADGLQFDKDSLTLPAGEVTVIAFTNEESQPHNVAVRDDGGSTIWRPEGGGIITGPGKEIEYNVAPIEPGEYTFFCEVHPAAMRGELTVA